MSETISSEDPRASATIVPTGATPALRGGALATALTTAVSLVLVGGVVTAAVRGSSSSTSAARLVPASAFAFAQVDLSLGDGQDRALSSFLGHFPDAPGTHGSGSLRDRLLSAMLRNSSDPHVDYARDVKPWLGDKAAVAGWVDRAGKPQAEFLLRSTDDGKARASLHRLAPELGVVFADGYAVVAQSQALASEAVTSAHGAALSSDPHLAADLARLSGPQVMSVWFDGSRATKAILGAMRGRFGPLSMMPGGMLTSPALSQMKARAVIGLHVTSTYAELVALSTGGSGTSSVGTSSSAMLTHLPNATIAAAEIASPGKVVAAAMSAATAMFGMFSGSVSSSSQSGLRPLSNDRYRQRLDPVAQIEKATGLRLPGDAQTLLGDSLVVAYGGLRGGGLPNIGLRSHPADVGQASAVADRVRGVIAHSTGMDLSVQPAGSDLVVATNPDYAGALAAGGNLGAQSRFAQAMGTLPDRVGFAAYVDLADIVPLFSHGQRDADHLDALGMWSGRSGGIDRLQVRLVVH
jgi:hypothetical protein